MTLTYANVQMRGVLSLLFSAMISRVLVFACPLFLSLSAATLPQSGTAESFYVRGTELARSGNFQQALQEFKRSAELSPQNPKVHNMLGVVLTQLGQLKEANEA